MKILTKILILIITTLVYGILTTYVWNTLIVPLFDVFTITILHAISAKFLYGIISFKYSFKEYMESIENDKEINSGIINYYLTLIIFVPLTFWVIAWVISLFI